MSLFHETGNDDIHTYLLFNKIISCGQGGKISSGIMLWSSEFILFLGDTQFKFMYFVEQFVCLFFLSGCVQCWRNSSISTQIRWVQEAQTAAQNTTYAAKMKLTSYLPAVGIWWEWKGHFSIYRAYRFSFHVAVNCEMKEGDWNMNLFHKYTLPSFIYGNCRWAGLKGWSSSFVSLFSNPFSEDYTGSKPELTLTEYRTWTLNNNSS